ncbi:NAD(P)H-dependent flavin oxidoreductase [Pseudoteredinibacter isoporae]|uniref:Nitronate monooxygenase n=1 Tax=Pseudoteredinibacter isoporae TaxID=570281 RepID=A0A7X0JSH6_9GAMM|nr:nitronate monooxygenase [Pseudoteredinibacter isoporae]MBB6520541.1 nitronate monooxygenase [Pseudoteredinibacter isoporae]NHO86108.1 nitronate monooxygenase [Pseudoteredinibacter isoporae]NIB25441.1 nitronate monooxygenase [Pseudoteredinibacter isoporae]
MNREELLDKLTLPAMCAPMFLISGPEMVIAASKAGLLGCFPTPNARTTEILDQWMENIKHELGDTPWAVNIVVHPSYPRRDADLELIKKHQPPIVVTALGSPAHIIEEVHAYGGMVVADVISPAFAKKAVAAGVDGLVLVAAGAGGHTGYLSPFVFVREVREFWDGLLILGGGLSSGADIRAVEIMGADMANLGTRFIPTEESMAQDGYKQMVVDCNADDIMISDAITGVKANWMIPSLVQAGYDPRNMPSAAGINFAEAGADAKKWKDIWAAGQGVGASQSVQSIEELSAELIKEYQQARGN